MTEKPTKILVDDDERAQREALRLYLERSGFSVEAAGASQHRYLPIRASTAAI